jgi:hypothetical protein
MRRPPVDVDMRAGDEARANGSSGDFGKRRDPGPMPPVVHEVTVGSSSTFAE